MNNFFKQFVIATSIFGVVNGGVMLKSYAAESCIIKVVRPQYAHEKIDHIQRKLAEKLLENGFRVLGPDSTRTTDFLATTTIHANTRSLGNCYYGLKLQITDASGEQIYVLNTHERSVRCVHGSDGGEDRRAARRENRVYPELLDELLSDLPTCEDLRASNV